MQETTTRWLITQAESHRLWFQIQEGKPSTEPNSLIIKMLEPKPKPQQKGKPVKYNV